MPPRRSNQRNNVGQAALAPNAGATPDFRSRIATVIEWLKPYKEIIAILLALSGTISGGVAYAVTYFATRSYVETVECVHTARFDLLALHTAIDDALIEAQTKFAGQLTLLPASVDTRALSAQIQKDIEQLKDRRNTKFKNYADQQKLLIAKCNPGVRVP